MDENLINTVFGLIMNYQKEEAQIILVEQLEKDINDKSAWFLFFQTMHWENELNEAIKLFNQYNPDFSIPYSVLDEARKRFFKPKNADDIIVRWFPFDSVPGGYISPLLMSITRDEYEANIGMPKKILDTWKKRPLKDRLGILRPAEANIWGHFDISKNRWMRYPLDLEVFYKGRVIYKEDLTLDQYLDLKKQSFVDYHGYDICYYKGAWYVHEVEIEFKDLRLLLDDAYARWDKKLENLRYNAKIQDDIGYTRQSIPNEVQIFVWNRDGGKCVKCGSQQNLEFDHIIPISKGGSNTARNIQLLCEKCNREKQAKIGG